MLYLKITPNQNGTHQSELVDLDGYQAIQEAVGGYFDVIMLAATPAGGAHVGDMFIADNGRNEGLPRNSRATELMEKFTTYGLAENARYVFMDLHAVMGTVLIAGPVNSDGESTPVTDDTLARLGLAVSA